MVLDSLINVSKEAARDGNFEEAIDLLEEARTQAIATFGKQSEWYAKTTFYKGYILYFQGAFKKVIPYWLEALTIQEEVLGETHLDYANTLLNLAIIYNRMGEYEKSMLRSAKSYAKAIS